MKKEYTNVIICSVLLAIATLLFWLFDIDLTIQNYFYDTAGKSWRFYSNHAVLWMYKFGTYPAIITAAAAVVIFSLGLSYENVKKYRKASLLIILLMLIGPGIITNVILKNYTGRPRPRDLVQFGGRNEYKKPLEFAAPGNGFSFPCGHCTMGFFFYAFYIIYRKKKKKFSYVPLAGSLLYGTAMGLGRMAQGGHFASDVLWAGGITVITAEFLAIVIKPDEPNRVIDSIKGANRGLVIAIASALLIITAFVFMIATPFTKYRDHYFGEINSAEIVSGHSNVTLKDSDKGFIVLKAGGFGLPWSDYIDVIHADKRLSYTVTQRGIFSELNSTIDVGFVPVSFESITITAGTGSIEYTAAVDCTHIYLATEKGSITFRPSSIHGLVSLGINASHGDITIQLPEKTSLAAGAGLFIYAVNGHIQLINYSSSFNTLSKDAQRISGSKEINITPLNSGGPRLIASAHKIDVEVPK